MKRNLTSFVTQEFDLIVVGGGIYGAFIAWDAAQRGLAVALVEKADFGSSTSANSSKTIHGGFRYFQHLHFGRVRRHIQERKYFMRIAPHLVLPLANLVPTYGHGTLGRQSFAFALPLFDLFSFDRNWRIAHDKHIPRGFMLSRDECLDLIPDLPSENLTGGAVFFDAQVYNTERLLISVLKSAENAGAVVANYVELVGFLQTDARISGIKAKDGLTGNQFEVRSKTVINATGPWVNQVLDLVKEKSLGTNVQFVQTIGLQTKQLFKEYGAGIPIKDDFSPGKRTLYKGGRLIFVFPWRGVSIVSSMFGTSEWKPAGKNISEDELVQFLDIMNRSMPSVSLQKNDIVSVHAGWLPADHIDHENGQISLLKKNQIIDHQREGLSGLISLITVKFTTSRTVAQKAVDLVFKKLNRSSPRCQTQETPVYGGNMHNFKEFMLQEAEKIPRGLSEHEHHNLMHRYGAAYTQVLQNIDGDNNEAQVSLDKFALLKAETLHGIREEMAQKLADIVFRRTELGMFGRPSVEMLQFCAQVMGSELGWDSEKVSGEIKEVNAAFIIVDDV